jgi:hypothetical protein
MKMTKGTPQFRHNFRAYVLSALALACCITAAMPAAAQDAKSPEIKASSLAGRWQATFSTYSAACGAGTELLTFTLDSNGMAMDAEHTSHSAKCGKMKESAGMVQVMSMNDKGTGSAMIMFGMAMSTVEFQVNSGLQVLNLVDTTEGTMAGTAIRVP